MGRNVVQHLIASCASSLSIWLWYTYNDIDATLQHPISVRDILCNDSVDSIGLRIQLCGINLNRDKTRA